LGDCSWFGSYDASLASQPKTEADGLVDFFRTHKKILQQKNLTDFERIKTQKLTKSREFHFF